MIHDALLCADIQLLHHSLFIFLIRFHDIYTVFIRFPCHRTDDKYLTMSSYVRKVTPLAGITRIILVLKPR